MIVYFQMCCSQCSCLYRGLPYLYSLTGFLEMLLGIIRLAVFFSPATTSVGGVPRKYSGQYVAAFIIDWISSIVPTLVGLFTALLILVICLKLCIWYGNSGENRVSSENNDSTRGMLRTLLRNKPLRRFFIMDCNCPCYRARPKLRFQLRLLLLLIFFVLRIVAIGLYLNAAQDNNSGASLAGVCAVSIIFLFNTFCLEMYRYCIWWHYTPARDSSCCGRSRKHERYIPYHLVGSNRNSNILGDRPCSSQPCHNRELDHIAVFHADDYQPQDRWKDVLQHSLNEHNEKKNNASCCRANADDDHQPHYIGFHRTTAECAVLIAKSEFRPGSGGWLGAGIYFARSVEDTFGKALHDGAYLIAEIRMGKVYEVDRAVIEKGNAKFDPSIFDFVHHGKWIDEYDTCYMLHHNPNRDEFAIKDGAKQIIKWVIVIGQPFDTKVERYGLNTEFDSTTCGCI